MLTIFLLALGLSSTAALAGPDPLSTVNAFHAAVQKGDQAAALAELSASVLIYESGHVERSRAEYANHHLPADISFSQSVKRKVLKSALQQGESLAVANQEVEITGRHQDKDVHLIGVETTVLVRQNGNWKIQHVHWSSRKAPRNPPH